MVEADVEPWGYSGQQNNFPGHLGLHTETLSRVVNENNKRFIWRHINEVCKELYRSQKDTSKYKFRKEQINQS